jgi:hypothetical protein
MVRNTAEFRRTNLMPDTGDAKDKSFTVFQSAAEEADTKRESDAM